MSPLPTTTVVHPAWVAHHAPTVESPMAVTVLLTRPVAGETYDPATGSTTPTAGTLVYEGAARVWTRAARARDDLRAGRQVTTVRWMVEVPSTADPAHVGDTLTVTGLALLDGATLTVADVVGGTLAWSGVMECTVDARA